MTFFQFLGTCEIAFLYMFVGLGVFLTFRVLCFPDLTVDGTFTLGAALSAYVTLMHDAPFSSLAIAFIGGMVMGALTAFLHFRFKIVPLMAGIIVMTALYSLNMRVMGGPNVSILGHDSIFSFLERQGFSAFETKLGVLFLFLAGVFMLLYGFLKTMTGLALRAIGNNQEAARYQGVPVERLTLLGVGLSNGLVALGGALFLQTQGFADVNMGLGTVIMGLAALTIGEILMPQSVLFLGLFSAVAGTLLYRCFVAAALNIKFLGLSPSDLNLITAFLVILSFAYKHKVSRARGVSC